MKALKRTSKHLSEPRDLEAMSGATKEKAAPRDARHWLRIVRSKEYEAHLQELAAEYQRLVSAGIE